ncbi:MAG: putative porin, partial [Candidatus Omnitrophota bacterium]
MKKLVSAAAIGLSLCLSGVGVSYAGEIDLLLEKLVDKGVLSGAEAQQVKYETQEQVKKEIATGKSESLPKWLQNIKLKGDLRLRYQYKHEKATNDYNKDTHLGRVRARLGLESRINEKILAGIGVATNSGGDPRST